MEGKIKQITVSGAVILRTNLQTNKKEIFATQRGYGDYKDGLEIPSGKLEPGETPEAWKPRVKISPILPIPQFYDNILFIRAISSVVRAEDS